MNITNNNISFKSNSNVIKKDGKSIIQFTNFLRKDFNFDDAVECLDKLTQNKKRVNTFCVACSDGSEPYSLAIKIKECSKNPEKLLPIYASDFDKYIIDANNRGIIMMSNKDFSALGLYKQNNPYFAPIDYNNDSITTMQIVKPELRKAVKFSCENLEDKIANIKDDKEDEVTFIMSRNVFPYLYDENKVKDVIKTAGQNLKEGSLFAIGDLDARLTGAQEYLRNNNFKQIKYNLYEKQSDSSDSQDIITLYNQMLINR